MLQTPSQLNIIRTPTSCPDTPREVGDGMEMRGAPPASDPAPVKVTSTYQASITSSGYSTPIFPNSPRLVFEKRSPRSISQRSVELEEEYPKRESIPSPAPSDTASRRNENNLIEEKAALRDHLKIQIQVNQELKKLLVASLGEDMAFHYERLATEKAELEMENENLIKKLCGQEEETERLNISCDVWRSKFLASRVQSDENQETAIRFQRRQREMDSAIRGLLREHRIRSENLEEIRDTLTHLYEALQWGKKSEKTPSKKGQIEPSIDEESVRLSNLISSQLLGSNKPRASKKAEYKKYLSSWKRVNTPSKFMSNETELEYEVKPTLAEKYVLQLLRDNGSTNSSCKSLDFYSTSARTSTPGPVLGRFHPHTKYDNITLACCSKCRGDIHIV